MKCILWDLDGVLADNGHAMSGNKSYHDLSEEQWTAFYSMLPLCQPNGRWVNLFHAFASVGVVNIIMTNRPDDQRDMTWVWLTEHGLYPELLFTRTPGRGHGGSKIERVQRVLDSGYTILLAIDDDPDACQDYEQAGYPVMYVHTGYHDAPSPAPAPQ